MNRDELYQRLIRLTSLPHCGQPFRDGLRIYDEAKAFAIKAHAGQTYGEKPFIYHLERVEDVLIRFKHGTARMRAAAWLHEVVAHTSVTAKQLEERFPGIIAAWVLGVTKEGAPNGGETTLAYYAKILAEGMHTIVLKLADRIANAEECLLNNAGLLAMYRREYPLFRHSLYSEGIADAMWAHLDVLMSCADTSTEVMCSTMS